MAILTALAGLINGVAVFVDGGATVSHVTGLVSKVAIAISSKDSKAPKAEGIPYDKGMR